MASADTINLGLGELDFEPIDEAKAALTQAVADGHNGYGPTRGLQTLREAIAENLQKYRPDVDFENVMITAGATQGILVSAMTLFDHGDEILVPDPGFVLYRPHAVMCGAFPVSYHLRQENEFVPDPDGLNADFYRRLAEGRIHFQQCTRCGKIVEFSNSTIEKLQQTVAKEHGFLITDHSLDIYGICQSCVEK